MTILKCFSVTVHNDKESLIQHKKYTSLKDNIISKIRLLLWQQYFNLCCTNGFFLHLALLCQFSRKLGLATRWQWTVPFGYVMGFWCVWLFWSCSSLWFTWRVRAVPLALSFHLGARGSFGSWLRWLCWEFFCTIQLFPVPWSAGFKRLGVKRDPLNPIWSTK